MIKCANCDTENVDSARVCIVCGVALEPQGEQQAKSDNASGHQARDAHPTPPEDKTRAIPELDDDFFEADAELAQQLKEEAQVASDKDEDTFDLPVDAKDLVADADDARSSTETVRVSDLDDDDGALYIGTVRFTADLVLRHVETNTVFRITNENLNEAVIGRATRETGFIPDIDLNKVDGKKLGVSRRHATITKRGDLIFITDHNSLNGTFLNGQKLVPEQARVVRDSDILRIGHVMLNVAFEKGTITES